MGFYTDWFLAGAGDAEAIASIATTEEHSFQDWPHLSLKGIGEMDLSALWDLLRSQSDVEDPEAELLFEEEGEVFVSRIEPAFVGALATVPLDRVASLAAEWQQTEELADWDVVDLEEVIREMVGFAQLAQRGSKVVLQLSVL